MCIPLCFNLKQSKLINAVSCKSRGLLKGISVTCFKAMGNNDGGKKSNPHHHLFTFPVAVHLSISRQHLIKNQRHLPVVRQTSVTWAFIHLPLPAEKLFPKCHRKLRTHQGIKFQSMCSSSIIWHKTNIMFWITLQKPCPWNSSLSQPGGGKQQSSHPSWVLSSS